MSTKFHVGDWVFFEFKLGQVKEVEGGRVCAVSDGYGTTGSHSLDDLCFPLSMEVKRISGEYEHWSSKLHREGSAGLNYPDIHRWLVEQWVACCHHLDDREYVVSSYEELRRFCQELLEIGRTPTRYGFPAMRGGGR